MKYDKAKSHMWTAEDIKTVATLWSTATGDEICYKLGVSKGQLMYIVNQMRDGGFKLPKKHKKGYVKNLISEVFTSLR